MEFSSQFGHLPIPTHQSAFSYHMTVTNQLTTCFQTATIAASQRSVTHLKQSTILPLLHT